MAANLCQIDGRVSMAAWGRIPVWHGTGQRSDDLMTVEQAHKLGGTDYPIELCQNYYMQAGAFVRGKGVQILRGDNHDVLGMASDDYRAIPNREAFELLETLISGGELKGVMTAGALGKGEKAWMQCVIGTIGVSDADRAISTLLVTTDHTASGCVKYGFSNVWVVCANTEAAAQHEWDRTGNYMPVFHTGNTRGQIETVRKMLDMANQRFLKWQDFAHDLTNIKVTKQEVHRLAIESNPPPNDQITRWLSGDNGGLSHWNRQYRNVVDEFISGPGMTLETRSGTAFGAFNAVTGYVDYKRGVYGGSDQEAAARNKTARIRSMWFGKGATIKNAALNGCIRHFVEKKPWSDQVTTTERLVNAFALAQN